MHNGWVDFFVFYFRREKPLRWKRGKIDLGFFALRKKKLLFQGLRESHVVRGSQLVHATVTQPLISKYALRGTPDEWRLARTRMQRKEDAGKGGKAWEESESLKERHPDKVFMLWE